MLWATPVQVGLAIYFMFEELGRSAFIGVLVIAIVVPVQALMGKRYRCVLSVDRGCGRCGNDHALNAVLTCRTWLPNPQYFCSSD